MSEGVQQQGGETEQLHSVEDQQRGEKGNGDASSSNVHRYRPYTIDDPDYKEVAQHPFPMVPPPNFGLLQHQNYNPYPPHQNSRQHGHRGQPLFQKVPEDDDDNEPLIDRSAFSSTQPTTSHNNVHVPESFPHTQEFEWLENSESSDGSENNENNNNSSIDANTDWSKGMSFSQRDQPIDYSLYCDPSIVEELNENKRSVRHLPEKVFLDARFKANPYEKIGKAIFQNRSALKMANLDTMFELTQTPENEVLTFADVCGGPGGFTEYILWRKMGGGIKEGSGNGAIGWGITLTGIDDWKLDKFNDDAPTINFNRCYGQDTTGNILNPQNILNFSEVINRATQNAGVGLVLADAGISVEGEEVNQEVRTKQLILCQVLTALNVLKAGGCFVCKIFDCFTPFTVGLLYIMYRYFGKISMIKPYTSRPANSERYIICKNFQTRKPESVINYLFDVNQSLNNFAETEEDIASIVDASRFPPHFIEYIKKTNHDIVSKQIESLQRILLYASNPEHPPIDQDEVKQRCLAFWEVPESRSIGKSLGKPMGRAAFPHSILGKYKNPTRENFGDMPPLRPKEEVLEEQKNKHRGNNVYDSSWSKPSREREREREREKPASTPSVSNGIDLLSTYLKQPPSRVTAVETPSTAPSTSSSSKLDYKELLRRERKSAGNSITTTVTTSTQPQIQKTTQKISPEKIVLAKKDPPKQTPTRQPPPINQLQPPSIDSSRKNPQKRKAANTPKETESEFQLSAAALAAIEKYKKK
eukprot:TRINITY_DN4007_c0_g1_i1.p1 TRINITY_DN4007_c0_g1~~TRINITY_DN4007_c0_g1_i1.p1  ORF type:complete len:793 (+),score=204.64 TRINITY_DN4007_c0_g1_i1:106-2379(+)